jgi:hypothetical protein
MIETRYFYHPAPGTYPPEPNKASASVANISVEAETLEAVAMWCGFGPMTSEELREQYDQANKARACMEKGWVAYFSELGDGEDEDRLRKKLGADMVEIFGPGGGSLWFINPKRKRLATDWLTEAKHVGYPFSRLVPVATGGPEEKRIPNGWYAGWGAFESVFLSDQPL